MKEFEIGQHVCYNYKPDDVYIITFVFRGMFGTVQYVDLEEVSKNKKEHLEIILSVSVRDIKNIVVK